jgi:hypothetical protein
VITESNEILMAIERTFIGAPYRALLPDPVSHRTHGHAKTEPI